MTTAEKSKILRSLACRTLLSAEAREIEVSEWSVFVMPDYGGPVEVQNRADVKRACDQAECNEEIGFLTQWDQETVNYLTKMYPLATLPPYTLNE